MEVLADPVESELAAVVSGYLYYSAAGLKISGRGGGGAEIWSDVIP